MAGNPPRYFPPKYFAAGYWSGADLPEGAMFASISAGANITATLTGDAEGFISASVSAGASVSASLTTSELAASAPEIRAAGGSSLGYQKHIDVISVSAVMTGGVEIYAEATVSRGRQAPNAVEDDERVLFELVAAFLNTRGRSENGIVV